MDFKFFVEHFKTADGALVVPGAVVGNHCSRAMFPNFVRVVEHLTINYWKIPHVTKQNYF